MNSTLTATPGRAFQSALLLTFGEDVAAPLCDTLTCAVAWASSRRPEGERLAWLKFSNAAIDLHNTLYDWVPFGVGLADLPFTRLPALCVAAAARDLYRAPVGGPVDDDACAAGWQRLADAARRFAADAPDGAKGGPA